MTGLCPDSLLNDLPLKLIRVCPALKLVTFLLLLLVSIPGFGAEEPVERQARMLINLMDYIAKDYGMAVEHGTVINAFEYAEMQEFGKNAQAYFKKLGRNGTLDSNSVMGGNIDTLNALISRKANPQEVAQQADRVKEQLLALNLVALVPDAWPDLTRGKSLYIMNCASCHGPEGAGDGQAGVALQPSPTNFTDADIMNGVAPMQAFNTIRLGIPGTGMRAFHELNDQQVWDVSFYIIGLHHAGHRVVPEATAALQLDQLATLSDDELRALYPDLDLPSVRLDPQQPSAISEEGPIALAQQHLNKALEAYREGNRDVALSLALDAYLQGVEPIEARVMASDNQLFNQLESSMMAVRGSIQASASLAEVEGHIDNALVHIGQAATLLSQEERSTGLTALIASSILVREGLEAFFIILAMLGILQSLNAPKAARWVHGGWIAAVLMGIAGWFFAGSLMQWSPESRELMEGLIALFAVIVLLYLGFWLHGKTEASKWKEFVETRIKKLLSNNNMIGLAAFSFVVVFREAFESVIFLSSLTVDGRTESSTGVLIGFVASAIILFAIAWAMLRLFKRLPIHKVFLYSSMVVLALAFILAGDGIHAIQEGGFIGIHPFPVNLKISALGIYPTYESMLVQLGVLLGIGVLWKVSSSKAQVASSK